MKKNHNLKNINNMTKNENKLNRYINIGRGAFSAADSFGTIGKFTAQVGIILLFCGLAAAVTSDICYGKVNKYKARVRAEKH